MSEINLPLYFLQPEADKSNLPLLIFLPGMDGSGELLAKQIPRLKRFFNIRCPKIGTQDLSNWYSLKQEVISWIAKFRVKHPETAIYLGGESFGACLALEVATTAPELWHRLILVNQAGCFRDRPWLSWGIPLSQLIPDFIYPYTTWGLLPFLASLHRIESKERIRLIKAIEAVSPRVVSWRLGLVEQFSLDPEKLKQMTKPVLLIASGSDRLLPSVEAGQKLQSLIPQSQLIVLPYSGHACLLEQEVDLTSLLNQANFLPRKVLSSLRV